MIKFYDNPFKMDASYPSSPTAAKSFKISRTGLN